ncbi:MAG: hypothetical protein RIC15_07965 [Vicingaceae bacterium]
MPKLKPFPTILRHQDREGIDARPARVHPGGGGFKVQDPLTFGQHGFLSSEMLKHASNFTE